MGAVALLPFLTAPTWFIDPELQVHPQGQGEACRQTNSFYTSPLCRAGQELLSIAENPDNSFAYLLTLGLFKDPVCGDTKERGLLT